MRIKRLIKYTCLKFIKPYIVFESFPDFSDNTRPVYDELVRRGYDKKYHLVWYIDNDKVAYLKDGVAEYWNPYDTTSFFKMFRCWGYFEKVKAIVICNRFIIPYPIDKCERSFYITHGSPIKDLRDYYTIPDRIDYCLVASKDIVDATAVALNYNRDKIIPLGYPRNDVFNCFPINVKKILQTNVDKVIVWYPTYKQHKGGKKIGCQHALPLIYDQNNAKHLNDYLRNNNVLIVIKPHFAQDLSYINDMKLSNIKFIDDEFYKQNNISSYQFIGGCDALLTDYSSVYYDFTLCNKPVGVIWEDIEEYTKDQRLVPDYEHYFQGAYKIYKIDELIEFISEIKNGIDSLKSQREEIRDFFNYSTDGKNTKRVVNFIIDKANL